MHPMLASLAALALAGCVAAPIISDPAEGPGDKARGKVTALSTLLEGKHRAVVVFVHGVGDHCPGYALDESAGWLNAAAQKSLGLVAVDPGALPVYRDILDDEFIPLHPHDAASKVTIGTRAFSYPASAAPADRIPIDAIEITWSQLTQWVKTNQLAYDLTEPSPAPTTSYPGCPYPESVAYKKPPPRQALNRVLKEQTLDRALADAVIYAGTYGRIMRRGTAEAICLALGGSPNSGGHICHWPAVPDTSARRQTAYFFVTHSLGSRLVYDTLLGLTGKDVTMSAATFDQREIEDAAPFAGYLMTETGAAYMMANQLAMLGLAYEDGTHTSSEGPIPFLLPMHGTPSANAGITPASAAATGSAANASSAPTTMVKTAALEFAARRLEIATARGEAVAPLTVVAFSDTNDLLSWAVPRWYQGESDQLRGHAVDFTNAFVQTSTRWFGVLENPGPAHSGYFTSADVWQVIRCGALEGRMRTCQ